MSLYPNTVGRFYGKSGKKPMGWLPCLVMLCTYCPLQLHSQSQKKFIQNSSANWWNAWLCETPVPNLNEARSGHWLLFPLWVSSGCALKPIKWLMNELKFGTVSMVSDSTFSSLPVGGITIGVTLMLKLLSSRIWNILMNPRWSLPSCFLSVF